MVSFPPMIQRLLPPILATMVLLTPGLASAKDAEGGQAVATGPAAATPAVAASAGTDATPTTLPAKTPAQPTENAPGVAPAPAVTTAPSSDLGGSLLQLGFGFLAVMALLFGCLWLLKRLNAPRGRSGGLMKVITALPLGTRERAVLIEVGDQWLLVGMGPNYMVKLADVPRQELPQTPSGPVVPDFANWLKRALDQRKGGAPHA